MAVELCQVTETSGRKASRFSDRVKVGALTARFLPRQETENGVSFPLLDPGTSGRPLVHSTLKLD